MSSFARWVEALGGAVGPDRIAGLRDDRGDDAAGTTTAKRASTTKAKSTTGTARTTRKAPAKKSS